MKRCTIAHSGRKAGQIANVVRVPGLAAIVIILLSGVTAWADVLRA